MPAPAFTAFLTLCLMSAPATARPPSPAASGNARSLELTAEPDGVEPEVFISPGLSTGLYFDAELLRAKDGGDTVELEKRGEFKLVDPGLATLRLIPSDTLRPGERLRLRVRFKDGAAPASAVFTLVVSEARAERVVEVYREMRPVESYRRETKEAHAATAKCLGELARTRAEHAGPGGLMGLLASRQVDKEGVRTRDLIRAVTFAPGNPLTVVSAWAYRSATHVAVELIMKAPEGARAWSAEGALLVGKRGQETQSLALWQAGPVAGEPSNTGRIVVGVEATQGELRGTYTLKLSEAGTGRTVILGNVTFP